MQKQFGVGSSEFGVSMVVTRPVDYFLRIVLSRVMYRWKKGNVRERERI